LHFFFNLPNTFQHQKQETEKKNVSGDRAWLAHEAINLTAICEQTIKTMWDPQYVITLQASTACYGNRFIFSLL
jgi:hypothetical protein